MKLKRSIMEGRITQKILKSLFKESKSITRLSKKEDIAYSYLTRILVDLEKGKIIKKKNKDGRTKIVELTKKGREIASKLIELENLLLLMEEGENGN